MNILDKIRCFPIKLDEIESVSTAAKRIQKSYYFKFRVKLFEMKRNRLYDKINFSIYDAKSLSDSQIRLENEIYYIAIRYVKNILGGSLA